MGRVRWDIEVPIPSGARIYTKGQVFDPPDGLNRETLIGYAVNDTVMHPNASYFRFHGKEWNALHPDALYMTCPDTLKAGLYALVLGAAQKEGFYEDIAKVCGVRSANMIMDYIMFLVSEKQDAVYMMKRALSDEVTFTGRPCSDSTYSKFFSDPANDSRSRAILDLWLQRCITGGLRSVYLVIDGAEEKAVEESGEGSGSTTGFLWAVQADGERAGLPVTCFFSRDGILDARVLNQAREYFREYGVTVRGALCDSGFCHPDAFRMMIDTGLPYAVMLKKSIMGFRSMVREHGAEIRRIEHFSIIFDVYGITGNVELFEGSSLESYVSLYFDPVKEALAGTDLLQRVLKAKSSIEEQIRQGKKVSVPKGLERYIHIHGKDKDRTVVMEEEAVCRDMKDAGFSAVATSDEMTAEQTMSVYSLRTAMEENLSYLERQPGTDAMRVFSTPAARMKFFIRFMAAILRYDIQKACAALDLKADGAIRDLGVFQYQLSNREYRYADHARDDQIALLEAFGISADMLRDFAPEITQRYLVEDEKHSRTDRFHALPWRRPVRKSTDQKRDSGASSDAAQAVTPPSEGNHTDSSSLTADPRPKNRGGRPKGSKNRKTLAREEAEKARREAEGDVEPVRSKGGRPKGSRDSYQRTRSTKKEMEERRKATGRTEG